MSKKRHIQRWTEEEDRIIQAMCAGNETNNAIAAALGRTYSSVEYRIAVLRGAGHKVSARQRQGRPRRDDALRVTMSPRFSGDELPLIRAAADAEGVPPCTWVRMKALAALRQPQE
jgi:hypothetical protein